MASQALRRPKGARGPGLRNCYLTVYGTVKAAPLSAAEKRAKRAERLLRAERIARATAAAALESVGRRPPRARARDHPNARRLS